MIDSVLKKHDSTPRRENSEGKNYKQKSFKDLDFIYKNAYSLKKHKVYNRLTDNKIRNFSLSDIQIHDENLELKQELNKQKNEITNLKTQLQYKQNELDKILTFNDPSVSLTNLSKKVKTQKQFIQNLRLEIVKNEEKYEKIRKKNKNCLINELEVEKNALNEECKRLVKIIEALLTSKNNEYSNTQDEDIQKSILISQTKKENQRLLDLLEEKNSEISK